MATRWKQMHRKRSRRMTRTGYINFVSRTRIFPLMVDWMFAERPSTRYFRERYFVSFVKEDGN